MGLVACQTDTDAGVDQSSNNGEYAYLDNLSQDQSAANNAASDFSCVKDLHSCYQVKNGKLIPPATAQQTQVQTQTVQTQTVQTQTVQTQQGSVSQAAAPAPVAVNNSIAMMPDQATSCDPTINGGAVWTNPKCAGILPLSSLNIEMPDRCRISRDAGVVSSVQMGKDAFKLKLLDDSDELPRFEVNGYSFKNIPLDLAIQNLVSEAGIRVYSDDALFPEVSGENIRGELKNVLDELTSAGDVYYRYNASKKQIVLSRWGRFVLTVPGGRIGMYAVLDALRGANITNVQPDFGSNEVYMRVKKETYTTVKKLMDTIQSSPNLVLFDIQVYRLAKKDVDCPVDWQKVVNQFGVSRVNASVNGIVGRMLTTKPQQPNASLLATLRQYGSSSLVSEGVAVMPDGWKVRFDIGQCAGNEIPEKQLSMLLQSKVLPKSRLESNIAVDTQAGEVTSFHTMYTVGDSLNVVGIPGKVLNPALGDSVEYVIVITPRLLKLVK